MPGMSDEVTIFDRILSGEVPCHKLYEDEQVLAFLDVFPLSPGHCLVIPKERRAQLHELSDDAQEMGQAFNGAKGKVRLLLLVSPG